MFNREADSTASGIHRRVTGAGVNLSTFDDACCSVPGFDNAVVCGTDKRFNRVVPRLFLPQFGLTNRLATKFTTVIG